MPLEFTRFRVPPAAGAPMKPNRIVAALAASLALFATSAQAEQIYWTNWTSKTFGTPAVHRAPSRFPAARSMPPVTAASSSMPATRETGIRIPAPTPPHSSITHRARPTSAFSYAAATRSSTRSPSSAPLVNPVMAIQSLGSGTVRSTTSGTPLHPPSAREAATGAAAHLPERRRQHAGRP